MTTLGMTEDFLQSSSEYHNTLCSINRNMNKEITIIGAGIAGLTTAISLKQKGFDPILFESTPVIKPVGAGLALAANAMKAFKRLNIMDEIKKRGQLTTRFDILNRNGKIITKSDSTKLSLEHSIDNYAIHRADLLSILLSKIDTDKIFLNKKSVGFERNKEKVIVKFEDGTTHETKCLVVAEGIHSPIRQAILPNSKPRYAGYTCWRGVINNPNLKIKNSSETWGKGKRFGIVPIGDNKVYWFVCINAPQNSKKHKDYTIEDLKREFNAFHAPITTILSNTKSSEMIWSDIIDLKPINNFAFDNILLIGDAAHATTPNMGQGACQAIEDAIILANEMEKSTKPSVAFKTFEKKRIKRTHKIVNKSLFIGKIGQLENGLLIALRNFVFSIMPSSINNKQMKELYEVEY